MIIDIQGDLIQINLEGANLKGYQISQLIFYGFSTVGEIIQLKTENPNQDILKIIDYFKSESIEFKTTSNLSKQLDVINERKEQLIKIYSLGNEIKNGNIDGELFYNFKKFTNTLPRKLKEHQVKAAYHLYSVKNGANFSVPGSGKTSVVISVYEKLKQENNCNLVFVVGPPSSFQPWQNEFFETTGRKIETTILSGISKSKRKSEYYSSKYFISELYLSTFHTLVNDYLDLIKLLNQEGVNAFFVIDEAHYMKQIGGTWASAVLEVAKYAKFRCILTGTPMPKSYTDIFNLFDFLWVRETPLTEEDKINISIYEKNQKNEKAKKILKKTIGPFFYRVRKKDLGLKPAIFHSPIILQMNKHENEIYELLKAKIYELSKSDFLDNQYILTKLWKGRMMRMRQSVSYPKLLLSSIENYQEDIIEENSKLLNVIRKYDSLELPAKLEFLTKKIKELRETNQKVLIWTNFIGTIELIKNHLEGINLRCDSIYGKTPSVKKELSEVKTRDEIRDLFVDPDSGLDILIANPAACAESISLHKTCFHAIYYDLSYNCAQYLQSLDRIHRVGGSEYNTANYYFLQYEYSIDQDIKENLDKKAKKMYDIVDEDYKIYNLDMLEDDIEDDSEAYRRIFKPRKY